MSQYEDLLRDATSRIAGARDEESLRSVERDFLGKQGAVQIVH